MTRPNIQRSSLTPGYGWNEAASRYVRLPGMQFVSAREIRGALDHTIERSADQMRQLSQQLRDGRISLAAWQQGMAQEIKTGHLASAAAAKGGWAQMTQADYGRVGQQVRVQYQYLRDFALQIQNGQQPLDGAFMRRAAMYAQSSRGAYHEIERREMARQGYTQERRRLNPADHCGDCVAYAARGWAPIGTLPRIGESQCRSFCKCSFEYGKSA